MIANRETGIEVAAVPDHEVATESDVQAAVEALTDEDWLRLQKAAKACMYGTAFKDSCELINEVVVRTLGAGDGGTGRRWPKSRVAFVPFVIETMKSLADASRESPQTARTDQLDPATLEGNDRAVRRGGPTPSSPSAEEEVLNEESARLTSARARYEMDRIEKQFVQDEDVSLLIMCLKDEMSAADTRASCGFTSTQYETVRKRLRRGLEKLFPNGRST